MAPSVITLPRRVQDAWVYQASCTVHSTDGGPVTLTTESPPGVTVRCETAALGRPTHLVTIELQEDHVPSRGGVRRLSVTLVATMGDARETLSIPILCQRPEDNE